MQIYIKDGNKEPNVLIQPKHLGTDGFSGDFLLVLKVDSMNAESITQKYGPWLLYIYYQVFHDLALKPN